MSEPFATTTETREAVCALCGSPNRERKSLGLYGSVSWTAERHDAPCGRPCMGAGVLPRDVRDRFGCGGSTFGDAKWTGEVHGWKVDGRRRCPMGCAFLDNPPSNPVTAMWRAASEVAVAAARRDEDDITAADGWHGAARPRGEES